METEYPHQVLRGNFNKGLMGVETGLREPLRIWASRDGGEGENKRTALPQICRGLEGRSQSSTIACCGRKTLAQLKLWLQKNPFTANVASKEGDGRKRVQALVSPCSCPLVPNSISHWRKLHVGWLRGGAQKIVGQTSPGDMSESTECHMCSYINLLMPLNASHLANKTAVYIGKVST